MTFKQLYEEACKVKPDSTIKVEVSVWRFSERHVGFLGATGPELKYEIWSEQLEKHFHGKTPAACLAAYKDAVAPGVAVESDFALVDDACQIDLGGEGGGA